MEFGDLPKDVLRGAGERLKRVRGEQTLERRVVDEAIETFWGDLRGRLHLEGIVRPQEAEDSHVIRAISNKDYSFIIDINPFSSEPKDQTISVTVKSKKDGKRKKINVFRPKGRKNGRVDIDGKKMNTKASINELLGLHKKMEPDPKPQKPRFGKSPRVSR